MNLANIMAISLNVNIAELKDKLPHPLTLVERGQELVVCRRNVPIAKVAPLKPKTDKAPGDVVGCMRGTVEIHGDLTEPCIPEEDWEMLR